MSAIERLDRKMGDVGEQARACLAILEAKRRNQELPDEADKRADKARKDGRGQQPLLPEPGRVQERRLA